MEDDTTICRVHKIYLDDMGYQVEIAENGKRTLELCKNNSYDLIILDGSLPDMKGVELGKKVRNLERKSSSNKKANCIVECLFC